MMNCYKIQFKGRWMQTILPSEEDLKKKLFHKQTVLISDQQKFPEMFKWKTATLILGALSSIVLIILLVIVYNLEAQEQVAVNLTFLSSLALESKILQNKEQVINLSKNFQQVYGTTKFVNAHLLYTTSQLTSDSIRYQIYGQENQKLLYLVRLELKQNIQTYPVSFALFMNSAFPLPKDDDFNSYIGSYYSFQTKEQRKSSLLSLYSDRYLRLFSTNPNIKSIAQCRNYDYVPQTTERAGSFSLLKDLVQFSFQTNAIKFNTEGWMCFWPAPTDQQDLQNMLTNILHPSILKNDTTVTLKNLEVYYLS